MNKYQVHPLTVKGVDYPVAVNASGIFSCEAGGEYLSDDSYEGLRNKVALATRKAAVKIAVPFLRYDSMSFLPGVATGLHGGNGKLMVRWDNGKVEQVDASWSWRTFGILTDNLRAEYLEIVGKEKEIEKMRKAFETAHGIDLGRIVKAAVETAANAGDV